MKQGREKTQEEQIQIARECVASGKNYGEMALKYKVRYQQVRNWTLRYAELGGAGWRTGGSGMNWSITKLGQAGMTQSMSRVAHCIDNGPMEGFWGILKREAIMETLYQQSQACADDPQLHPLLQHPQGPAQSWRADANGKALFGLSGIKNG